MFKKWKRLMNKIAIPAILVATVMVAGMFAFAPVDQVSTVHTAILSGTTGLVCVDEESVVLADANPDNDIITYTFSQPILLTQILFNADATFDGDGVNFDNWEADGALFSDTNMNEDISDTISSHALSDNSIGLESVMIENTFAFTLDGGGPDQFDEISITFCGFTANPESFTSDDITSGQVPG